jgi:ComF family protein
VSSFLREFLTGCTQLLYPPICLVCRTNIETAVEPSLCRKCDAALRHDPAEVCPFCAATIGAFTDVSSGCAKCRDQSLRFDATLRLGIYDDVLRDAVLAIKSLSGDVLAHTLGQLWAERHREQLRANPVDLVVPVPLHWFRRLQRGYNQSAAVASSIAANLALKHQPHCLVRCRPTPSQVGQSATARRQNVLGAFRVNRLSRVTNLRILLIDDVMTTGATVNEATRTLLAAGAAQVTVGILARRL